MSAAGDATAYWKRLRDAPRAVPSDRRGKARRLNTVLALSWRYSTANSTASANLASPLAAAARSAAGALAPSAS